MKIYANAPLLNTLGSMKQSGRLPHALLLFGESGMGRTTIARHVSALILCENPSENGEACGECANCKKHAADIHPDVKYVEHSGKRLGFSMETMRALIYDSYILPNDSSSKVYILDNCDSFGVLQQNTLLKLIEEPPDFAYFILTASSPDLLLPTILSRVITLGISPCSDGECRQALLEHGISAADAEEAATTFPGNIGKCLRYLSDDGLKRLVWAARNITDGIIKSSEYTIQRQFFAAGTDRDSIRQLLLLLDLIVRDAAIRRISSESSEQCRFIGCYRQGSEALAARISASQAAEIHKNISTALEMLEANGNVSAVLPALKLCV